MVAQLTKNEDTELLMEYLLENGADPGCPEPGEICSGVHKNPTALDWAIELGKNDLIDILLSHGAKFCPNSSRTAAHCGVDSIMKRIKESGMNIDE